MQEEWGPPAATWGPPAAMHQTPSDGWLILFSLATYDGLANTPEQLLCRCLLPCYITTLTVSIISEHWLLKLSFLLIY